MTPAARLARDEAAPALVALHRALSRLAGVVTVMQTGAHPDDEQSGLLAWLRFGRGLRTVVACSTRGEGGQNILDAAQGGALGAIRSREMEEAARVLDADVVWLGHGPDDPVHDFGFSKDGDATFVRWGEARVVARLADAYRRHRPDIVIPTFLDVPGQHGHHRAMTRAAAAAIAVAADPATAIAGLAPWRVAKLYLPAWSGGGGTYDDEVAPPPATLVERATGRDEATGADFDRIGEWSRRRHATQGMGRWRDAPRTEWPLHLVGGGPETSITDGLPVELGVAAADEAVAAARAAFPDRARVVAALALADAALAEAPATHRTARRRQEIAAALAIAAGLDVSARAWPAAVEPGGTAELSVRVASPLVAGVTGLRIAPVVPPGVSAEAAALEPGQPCVIAVGIAPEAAFTEAFEPAWSALGGNGPASVRLEATVAGRRIAVPADLDEPLRIVPRAVLTAEPSDFVVRRGAVRPLSLRWPEPEIALVPPAGWALDQGGGTVTLTPPADLPAGLTRIAPTLDGRPARTVFAASYPHIGAVAHARPAEIRVLCLDLAIPAGARIGVVAGPGDRLALWLARLGCDVASLDRIEPGTDLAAFTTVVVGPLAFGTRPDLGPAVPALHRFVRAGGHLVTFYQRPDQGWDADRTPPLRLAIGTPSLRWRVTDPGAPVTVMDPVHPLLVGPNQIGPGDWDGWDKDRGLYFAAARDPAYAALLAMSDHGEAPLDGALVSARVGAGRHTHVALTLHHQADRMVPGALRLLANLMQPAG